MLERHASCRAKNLFVKNQLMSVKISQVIRIANAPLYETMRTHDLELAAFNLIYFVQLLCMRFGFTDSTTGNDHCVIIFGC